MTKHTQGPWNVSHESDAGMNRLYIIKTDDLREIAFTSHRDFDGIPDDAQANAALIAAAPELLEALENTLWAIKKFKEQTGLDLERSYPVLFDHLPRARNAIAKAKG